MNPDVEIIVVGLMNTLNGLMIEVDENTTVDFGDYMGIVLDIVNTHVSTYATVQVISNPAYENANIYYAEAPKVEVKPTQAKKAEVKPKQEIKKAEVKPVVKVDTLQANEIAQEELSEETPVPQEVLVELDDNKIIEEQQQEELIQAQEVKEIEQIAQGNTHKKGLINKLIDFK